MQGLLLLASSAFALVIPKGNPVANLNYARLIGSQDTTTGVNQFLGVPFAQPPVNDLRFAPPKPISSYLGTLNATSFAPSCFQVADPVFYPSGVSEDCLYVNVWTPAGTRPGDNLPVIVWTYGGSFTTGGTATFVYNGASLVQASIAINKPVVVVSIAYRVNVFGFAASSELASANALNLGLLDQKAAHEWVRNHITRFGGDSGNVASMGESAGAFSIAHHMTSSLASQDDEFPLFDKAILQSGAGTTLMPNCSALKPQFDGILAAANCTTAASGIQCLRNLTAQDLFAAGVKSGQSFAPCVDGTYIVQNPFAALASGNFAQIPLLAGYNSDEGSLFALQFNSEQAFDYLFTNVPNPQDQAALFAEYPLANYSSPYAAATDFLGDYLFKCPSRIFSSTVSSVAPSTFAYRFNKAPNATDNDFSYWGPNTYFLGVAHASELIYTFNDASLFTTDAERALSKSITHYWINFAYHNNPNGYGLPFWPPVWAGGRVRFDATGPVSESLDADSKAEKCSVWKTVLQKQY